MVVRKTCGFESRDSGGPQVESGWHVACTGEPMSRRMRKRTSERASQHLCHLALVATLACLGCASSLRRFPIAAPLLRDPDRRPFAPMPEPPELTHRWTLADAMVLQPASRFFAVTPGDEATNVNALDEVPDSSWFENRIGRGALSPEAIARGPCHEKPLDPAGPWTIVSGKTGGAYPGFVIQDADERRYLLKFDGVVQPPRSSASEMVVSRLYHAAGYNVPCYQLVSFEEKVLRIAPNAETTTSMGEKGPFTQAHITEALAKAIRYADGRYRGVASRWLPGKPLGPWCYDGTLEGDRNDVVPHEDRREVRASRLVAAWTNNFDQRVENTFATWIETGGGRGYVSHALIDFGAALGSLDGRGSIYRLRRRGYAYDFDAGQILVDFASLGIVTRPWDEIADGPSSIVFGFFAVEHFEPESWRPPLPNPAFARLTKRDGSWMARILSRFENEHIAAAVARGGLAPKLRRRLFEVLRGRRDAILEAYLFGVSPLTAPRVVAQGKKRELCLTDLGARWRPEDRVSARARAYGSERPRRATEASVRRTLRDCLCVDLAGLDDDYVVVDLWTELGERRPPPARVHVARVEGGQRVVGLERPYDHDAFP